MRVCHSGLDVGGVQAQVLRSLRRLVPVDVAFFATADPGTLQFTGAHSEEPLVAAAPRFLANKLAGVDVNTFTSLATSAAHMATLDSATGRSRFESERYREIMRPVGLGDELRAALVAGLECWGYLCLHRADGPLGFSRREATVVARLGPHIAYALRLALLGSRGPVRGGDRQPGVRLLAARGMRVVVDYLHNGTAAEEVVAGIEAAGGQAMAVQADVREPATVESMIEQVQAAWGGIDVLVHNALTPYVIKPFQDMTWEELGGKLDDEMRAAFAVTKAVLHAMTEQGWGRIIYLGTGLSRQPREGMIALGTAKAALAQFARYLAQELGPRGITVNVVEPGPVEDTHMMAEVFDEEHKQRQVAATPLGRPAHPGDVAQAVAFYASEDNAFMTGTTAAVNGGMSMY